MPRSGPRPASPHRPELSRRLSSLQSALSAAWVAHPHPAGHLAKLALSLALRLCRLSGCPMAVLGEGKERLAQSLGMSVDLADDGRRQPRRAGRAGAVHHRRGERRRSRVPGYGWLDHRAGHVHEGRFRAPAACASCACDRAAASSHGGRPCGVTLRAHRNGLVFGSHVSDRYPHAVSETFASVVSVFYIHPVHRMQYRKHLALTFPFLLILDPTYAIPEKFSTNVSAFACADHVFGVLGDYVAFRYADRIGHV